MTIHFRIDASYARHSHFTVFVGGANCGTLRMRTDELVHFFMIFRHGLSPTMDHYRESGKLWTPEEEGEHVHVDGV